MSDPSIPPPPPSPAPGDTYYVLDSPYEIDRWRPLAHWAMFIPHGIILYVLGIAARAVFFVYWIILIFTGKLQPSLYGFLAMNERYDSRGAGFLLGFSQEYPPFEFPMGGADDGHYPPIRLNLPEPPDEAPRTAAFNILLAIPHYIVLAVFGIGAMFAIIVAWFAVLITGRWPQGLRDYVVQVTNYYYRVWVYVTMVRNEYPRFGL